MMRVWTRPLLLGLIVAALAAWAGVAAIPYAIMEGAVRKLAAQGAGLNRMSHGELASADRQPVVRPSPDLAYSSCPFDLSDSPLVIDVVPVAGRYHSLSIFDAATNAIFVRNDLEARGTSYRIIVARDDQVVPEGAEVVRTAHNRGIALVRLLLKERTELAMLGPARRKSTCRLLTKGK